MRGDIRRIPIRHHSQIVVEVSGYVPPHAHYVFPLAILSVVTRIGRLLPLVLLAGVLAACGSSGSGSPSNPTVAPAKTFQLAGFTPGAAVAPRQPVVISFHVVLPSGETLTRFKKGAGPHTGVHLIIVRNDLASIIHRHPRVAADGTVRQTVTFPAPGRYHVLVDVYPGAAGHAAARELPADLVDHGRREGQRRCRCRRTHPRTRSRATT